MFKFRQFVETDDVDVEELVEESKKNGNLCTNCEGSGCEDCRYTGNSLKPKQVKRVHPKGQTKRKRKKIFGFI